MSKNTEESIKQKIKNNQDVLNRGDIFVNLEISDIFPKYFSDFMNRPHNSCCKYLSFNYDEICKQYENFAKPYKTGNVETEINLIEYKIKCLKKELDDLKKYEKY